AEGALAPAGRGLRLRRHVRRGALGPPRGQARPRPAPGRPARAAADLPGPLVSSLRGWDRHGAESGRALRDFQSEARGGVRGGALLGEGADAIACRRGRGLDRREHAEGVAGGVHEAAAGVAWDAWADRVELLAPAVGFFGFAEAEAGLGAQHADAEAQDR